MLPNKKRLLAGLINFQTFTEITWFTFEEFEKKAEELDIQHPGEGYQLAYNETLNRIFRDYVDECLHEERAMSTLSELVEYFDTYLMKKYVEECQNQSIDVNIKLNDNGINLETLKSFNDILEGIPVTNVLYETYKKFENGELTLDSTYEYTKKRANTVPSRKEARELVSYAAFLEERNEERSILAMLLSLPTHFKELRAISAMRKLAAKAGNIDVLEYEAENENNKIFRLRNEVDQRLINAQAPSEKEIDLERIQQMDSQILGEYLDDKEFSRIADLIESSANETVLDITLDLEQIDENFELGGSVSEDSLFSDESMIIDDAAFEIDDDDVSLAMSLADDSVAKSFETEKISVEVHELAENVNVTEQSPRVEENKPPVKGKLIE